MSDNVLVILQQAITKEEDRQAYYEDAAQRVCHPLAQQTFLALAHQEQAHAEFVRAYYEKMKAEAGWPDPAECGKQCRIEGGKVSEIFAHARASIEGEVTCGTELAEAYKIAMQGERDAIEFYKAQLDAATEPNAKAFYGALVDAERSHLQLLVSTEEYLTAPEGWFFGEEQWIVEG
jgi:rubrerythrin